MKVVKNIFFWVLTAIIAIMGLAFMPSFGGVLLLLCALMVAPIGIIQNVLNNLAKAIFKKKKHPRRMKGLIITILVFVGIIAGGSSVEPVEVPETPEASIQQEVEEPSIDVEPEEEPVVEEQEPEKEPEPEEPEEVPIVVEEPEKEPATEPEEPAVEEPEEVPVENSTFEVHFIDVGQADASLVLCDGKAMLIDGGNSEDSSLIYSYLKNKGISHLDYIVATHGHEDHVGGLSGALNYATVGTALCSVKDYDSEAFEDFVKYLGKQNKEIEVPSVGDTFKLGSASVEIVGVDGTNTDHNNTSIVLRIVYGETSFLFTGDAEREAEQTILSSGYELGSTVLKVGHHGSENSTTYPFLREIMPEYAVISVGENNSYGHPTEDALSRLRDADVKVFRTDLQGTVICVSDGTTVSFTVDRNEDADTLAPKEPEVLEAPPVVEEPVVEPEPEEPQAVGTNYVGNKNSYKFHYDWCGSVKKMKESNKYYYTGTRDEMIAKGYEPCKNCNP